MLSLLFTIAVKSNQKGLGLFLCLWKLQKRFPHAKQTVSLVLCSFILSSPLFCFITSIKSRPFSNYQVTVFIKIWLVNFKILNMKSGPPLYYFTTHDTCHFEWFSIENCIEKCFNVRYSIEFSIQWLWSIATNPSLELTGTTYYFTTILIHHNTITPVHPLRDSLDTESV